jgi:hypothetical protein
VLYRVLLPDQKECWWLAQEVYCCVVSASKGSGILAVWRGGCVLGGASLGSTGTVGSQRR